MVVIHTRAKDQGQRSVGSKDRLETDGQMDGSGCIISRANAVSKYSTGWRESNLLATVSQKGTPNYFVK